MTRNEELIKSEGTRWIWTKEWEKGYVFLALLTAGHEPGPEAQGVPPLEEAPRFDIRLLGTSYTPGFWKHVLCVHSFLKKRRRNNVKML